MKALLHTLLAAIIGGAVTGTAAELSGANPTARKLGVSAAAGALVAVAALWKKKPTRSP